MSSLFQLAAAAPSPFFSRTKRKMSGPAVMIALDMEAGGNGGSAISNTSSSNDRTSSGGGSSDATGRGAALRTASGTKLLGNGPTSSSSSSSVSNSALGRLDIDVREVLGFACWKVLSLLVVVLAVADWVFFFRFVVEPAAPRARLQNGALWSLFTAALLSFRRALRARCGADVRALADHLEIFIAVSLVMVFATNVAFLLHAPAAAPLRDLGFMLVPEQGEHSRWRPLSDVLTAVVPVLGLLQTLVLPRAARCRVIATFFRVATVAYALRTLTVALTSLPGPAPHCRPGHARYAPPQTWVDIVTRVGPMYGKFDSCGDLIFSGHMAYTNSALLLYLRTLDAHCPRFSRLRWLAGAAFLLALAGLCVAGRKHYSVDVVLGVVVSTLVYFHFEHSWVPPCVQQLHAPPAAIARRKSVGAASYSLVKPGATQALGFGSSKASDFEIFDDGDDDELLLFPRRAGTSQQQQQAAGHPSQMSAVDFIC